MTNRFWRSVAEGLEISVRATPRGGRDSIDGVVAGAGGAAWLAVRVTVPPDDGKANEAVVRLIANHFGIPPRDVVLASGATARLKRLKIRGDSDKLGLIAARMEEK